MWCAPTKHWWDTSSIGDHKKIVVTDHIYKNSVLPKFYHLFVMRLATWHNRFILKSVCAEFFRHRKLVTFKSHWLVAMWFSGPIYRNLHTTRLRLVLYIGSLWFPSQYRYCPTVSCRESGKCVKNLSNTIHSIHSISNHNLHHLNLLRHHQLPRMSHIYYYHSCNTKNQYKRSLKTIEEWRLLRPSHTITEIAKEVVIVHTHYNFFSQLQQFLNSFIYRQRFA